MCDILEPFLAISLALFGFTPLWGPLVVVHLGVLGHAPLFGTVVRNSTLGFPCSVLFLATEA